MRSSDFALTARVALLVLLSGCQSEPATAERDGSAQPDARQTKTLALEQMRAPGAALTVDSTAFQAGEPIPPQHSVFGQSLSPPLQWSGAPEGTESFAVIVEDPDAPTPRPFVHWLIYNIPADRTQLPQGVATEPVLQTLGGARQGRNSQGSIGYFGPKPPAGDPPHQYYFQVLALDRMLDLPPGADRETLLADLRDHVLAAGQLIGTYERK